MIAPEQRQVEQRAAETNSRRKSIEGANGARERKSWRDVSAKLCFQIHPLPFFLQIQLGFRQQRSQRDILVLLGLRRCENGYLRSGVLLQRQADRLLQRHL